MLVRVSHPAWHRGLLGAAWCAYYCGALGSHPVCLREAVTCPDLGSGAPVRAGQEPPGPAGPGSPGLESGLRSLMDSVASAATGPARAGVSRELPCVFVADHEVRQQRPAVCWGPRARHCHLSVQKPGPCPPPIPPPPNTTLGPTGSSGSLARVQTLLCGRHPGSPWARLLIWGAQPPSAQSWRIWPLSAHASVHPNAPQGSTASGRRGEQSWSSRPGSDSDNSSFNSGAGSEGCQQPGASLTKGP